MSKNRKLVCGIGINDLDYEVRKTSIQIDDKGNSKIIVDQCSIYQCWSDLLWRCNSKSKNPRRTRYIDCKVNPEWTLASNFHRWAIENKYNKSLKLDKDILISGNKEYGPDTCAFVPDYINASIVVLPSGKYPIGVNVQSQYVNDSRENLRKYTARVYEGGPGSERIFLGNFGSSEEAHKAWQIGKAISIERAIGFYEKEDCFREDVKQALVERCLRLKLDSKLGIETTSL